MCVACDLLTGLDLDDLAAAEPPVWSLHLPQDLAGLSLENALPATLARVPTSAASSSAYLAALPVDSAPIVERALEDYERYRAAAAAGRLHGAQRWLWVLPSPLTWLSRHLPAERLADRLPPFEALLNDALARIAAAVPARDLALQWDLAAETALWESRGKDLTAGRRIAGKVLEGLTGLAATWAADAQLGFHLCRRDAEGAWAPDPVDATQTSHLAGALLASLDRNVDFLHLPASRTPADGDWYAPLTKLQAWPDTTLHLGVAWAGEGEAVVRERLQAVHSMLSRAVAAPACDADTTGARLALEAALTPR